MCFQITIIRYPSTLAIEILLRYGHNILFIIFLLHQLSPPQFLEMDKSPTMGKSPALPETQDILEKVQNISKQNNEYVGTTIAKVLVSPQIMRSPAIQAKMQELLEQVIEPEMHLDDQDVPSVDYNILASPGVKKLATPTLKKMPQVLEPINTSEQAQEQQILPKSPLIRPVESNEIDESAPEASPNINKSNELQAASPAKKPSSPQQEAHDLDLLTDDSLFTLENIALETPPAGQGEALVNIDLLPPEDVVPDLERSARLLNLSQVEREFPEDVDMGRKLDQIFHPEEARSCYDVKRCQKLKVEPAPQCTGCQRRQHIELTLLDFIHKFFRNEPIGLFDVISEDMMKNLDEKAYEVYSERKLSIMQEFNIGPNEHFANLASLRFGAPLKIHQAMMNTERRMCDIYNKALEDEAVQNGKNLDDIESQKIKTLKEKGVQVKKVTPVFILAQLVCEAIFNVPGYTAYSLMPVLRSRYKYLHPDYAQGLIQLPSVRDVRQALKITGAGVIGGAGSAEPPPDSSEKPCTVTVPQIREFYLQQIDRKPSIERFINCLKDLDLGKQVLSNLSASGVEGFQTLETQQSQIITPDDLDMYLTVMCRLHPGLEFLRATPDFQAAYVETCIVRVMLENDLRGSGVLNIQQFKHGNLLGEFWVIQRSSDLNKCLRYFSYEHFYVIYCQFWQLDTDHDQYISEEDLANYGQITCPYIFYCQCEPGTPKDQCRCQRVYNRLVVERIFQNVGFPLKEAGKMNYGEFVRFILCEENKDSAWGQEYFFRLLDVDGDGVLSPQDYRQFLPGMQQLYRCHGRELTECRFEDLMCQLTDAAHHTQYVCGLDVVHEEFERQCITRRDVRRSRVPGNFFNPFVSFLRAQQFDLKDPYTIKYPAAAPEKNSWDRFARAMYDLMEDGDDPQESATGALDGGALD